MCVLSCASNTAAQDFSAVGQFSVSANPSGPWSYGSTKTLGGDFTRMAGTDKCGSLECWIASIGAGGAPWMRINRAGAVPNCSAAGLTPKTVLHMHPGPNGEFSVVRWTAPADHLVSITGSFVGLDNPTTTDVHVLAKNVAVFDGDINRRGKTVPFQISREVKAGDTIDFLVGYGSNKNYSTDSTGLSATISTVSKAAALADAIKATGKVDVYGVLFDTDRSEVRPESKTALDQVAALLKDDPTLKVEVAGHTDNIGSAAANLALSKARAAAVVRWLVTAYGINAAQLVANGYGDTKPVAPNDTEANRAKNRRVELRKV
jgi:outer membrane protein OmpA-like peptidoglycan-associated protein